MFISRLSLMNFRNLINFDVELKSGINIFFGENAQGKTNILEAVYMCGTGRSHRTNIEKELIAFNENEAHIKLYCSKKNISDRIDVHLKRDGKKGIAVNNIPIKKLGELFGVVNTVMFSPEDLRLIKSGPSERRRFMDLEICQLSNVYFYDLQQYYKSLKQRNFLLKKIQKDSSQREMIFVWDNQLVKYGIRVINARKSFISKINELSGELHSKITGGKEALSISYKPSVSIDDFEERLFRNIEKDIFYGTTSLGPHKDDLIFFINGCDARDYGSQGQQRTASLSVKLSEIELIKNERLVSPVLLLDDVLSELDESRQRALIDGAFGVQTLITCTGVEDIIKKFDGNSIIFNVKNGKIITK